MNLRKINKGKRTSSLKKKMLNRKHETVVISYPDDVEERKRRNS